MSTDEAMTLIHAALEAVLPGSSSKVTLDTDLVAEDVLDSLDLMNFLFELEQAMGLKLEAITEEYSDFRIRSLVTLIRAV